VHSGVFWSFHSSFSVITKFTETKFMWEAFTHFRWLKWCLLVEKNIFLSCRWICRYVIFLLIWHVLVVVRQFIVNEFFFLFLLSLENYRLVIWFVIDIWILVFIFFYFCSWSFCKSFICFQFHHSILIFHMLFFF
jgi:hypothetical protein